MHGVAPYTDDREHWRNCRDKSNCARCHFESGFRGELRRGGHAGLPDANKSWAQKFLFRHPVLGTRTWICCSPYRYGTFGIGCWVCAHFSPDKWASSFSRLQVTGRDYIGVSAFNAHAATKGHQAALDKMLAELAGSQPTAEQGVLTGVCQTVPRLDRFFLAGCLASRHDTYSDFPTFIQALAIGCNLPQSGDFSRKVAQQMQVALAEPLRQQDQNVMRVASPPF